MLGYKTLWRHAIAAQQVSSQAFKQNGSHLRLFSRPQSDRQWNFWVPLFSTVALLAVSTSLYNAQQSLCEAAKEGKEEEKKELLRNELWYRVQVVQWPANVPIHDRLCGKQLTKKFKGYYAGLFDGNNGWQLADYCSQKLHVYIEENLQNATNEKQVKAAITKAFYQLDAEWEKVATIAFEAGYPQTAYIGSTALVAIVHDNKLYVANAGHSKAVLLRRNENQSFSALPVSKTFHVQDPKEQQKLTKMFSAEKDLLKSNTAMIGSSLPRVKGVLAATRTLGNHWLKSGKLATHGFSGESGFKDSIEKFRKAYVSGEPDISVTDLTAEDKWLVLATDGMWSNFKRKDVPAVIGNNNTDSFEVVKQLVEHALDRLCYKEGLTRDFLGDLQPGKRKRELADDITVMVIDLENQFKI